MPVVPPSVHTMLANGEGRPRRRLRWTGHAVCIALGAVALSACHGSSHLELQVTTTVDGSDAAPGDGVCEMTAGAADCSLRAAVDEVNARPTGSRAIVNVPPGTYTLTGAAEDDANASGDLDVSGFVGFKADAPGVVIDGGGLDRVFDVRGNITLHGMTVRGGLVLGDLGGGIIVRTGGRAQVNLSTITANSAVFGGGMEVEDDASLVVVASTISGNRADEVGGGIGTFGSVRLFSATVTDNTNEGITVADFGDGDVTLESTIVADQAAGADCAGTVTSAGYNLDSDGTCLPVPGVGDQAAATASLRSLGDHGGFTPTHLLNADSDGLDADNGASRLPIDQRLTARPRVLPTTSGPPR